MAVGGILIFKVKIFLIRLNKENLKNLFLIGIAEMLVLAGWTKMVADARVLMSGLVTIVNIFIWYYALSRVATKLGDWRLVLLYALGCALGTALSTWLASRKRPAGKQPKTV
ncbi:hypothetical protein COX22_00625 [Candidatus Falkowbacteria bacterium CG23_combo_of_CG06-09_8_20_14_all_49_15]|uniref:DUF5698 domain-containing protein n=1 Tax=Candidatus Falkowbacteria bacterium CG23_combo_of_CG06-09_8_20_14_all_49_15 TaxID=1974572 RepID=A0A2G9ZM13_9BACT|nr:MAG: hypothetical protein COX22_00625 [Candidatus Falkowbacteria bacterium CG23_combo_of_CG06-09_8_20_14_all_49_15]